MYSPAGISESVLFKRSGFSRVKKGSCFAPTIVSIPRVARSSYHARCKTTRLNVFAPRMGFANKDCCKRTACQRRRNNLACRFSKGAWDDFHTPSPRRNKLCTQDLPSLLLWAVASLFFFRRQNNAGRWLRQYFLNHLLCGLNLLIAWDNVIFR